MEYTSIGKGNAALTTGIIGTAGVGLGLLNNLLGNMSGNACATSEDHCVNRYELGLQQQLSAEKSKTSLLEANIYNDQKTLELYRYIDGKLEGVNSRLCAQDVVNAQVVANISCMQQSISALQGLTKTIIPIGNVCPTPMMEYNSWVAPTAPATAG